MTLYTKGRRKEYAICADLKAMGYTIVQRTAGSHSDVDILAIHKDTKKIKFIQSKRTLKEDMKFTDNKEKWKIESDMSWLNGKFDVEFEVV